MDLKYRKGMDSDFLLKLEAPIEWVYGKTLGEDRYFYFFFFIFI